MNGSIPQAGSSGEQKSLATKSAGVTAPTALPPAGAVGQAAKSDCGCGGARSAGASAVLNVGAGDTAPSIRPDDEGGGASVSTWQNNKRIVGLWSINQNRNSWVYVDGVGWKRLANNSDSAIVALSMLGAHARDKGSAVNYREESDGLIREMYVW